MPVSRFDTSIDKGYSSNYIPLPFSELQGIAANHQKKYDDSIEDSYKLNDLMSTVPSINDPQLGLSNITAKQKLDAKYHPKIEEITNRIVKGNSFNAQRDLNSLKREWANDPDRIELENSYANYKAYKEDKTKKGDKYAIYKDPYLNQQLIDNNGELQPFRFSGLGEVQDHAGEARDQMKDIAKNGFDSKNSVLGEDGNIYTKDSHGTFVKDNRVRQLAEQKVIPFISTEKGKDYLQLLKYQNPNASQQDLFKGVADYLHAAGANQVFSNFGGGKDVDVTGLSTLKAKKAMEDEANTNSLIGQSLEGPTYNPVENDKDFQELKNNGVLKTNKDGLIKIDWENVNKANPTYSKYNYDKGSVERVTSEKQSLDKQVQLAKQMQKMANVVGYQGKVDSKSYETIASAYNILTKSRLFGEQLSAPVANLESDKITRNWDNTTAFNPEDINHLADKPELKEGDKIVINERQTNSNGEIIKKGVIVNKDGTRTPIALKSNSLEDSGFFDKVGKLGITSAQYQTGQLKGSGEKTQDGKEVIHQENIPYIGHISTVANPKNKQDLQYRLVTEDNKKVLFSNYSDLQRYLESEYYTKTPEGKSDTQELINKKKQFETNFEE